MLFANERNANVPKIEPVNNIASVPAGMFTEIKNNSGSVMTAFTVANIAENSVSSRRFSNLFSAMGESDANNAETNANTYHSIIIMELF